MNIDSLKANVYNIVDGDTFDAKIYWASPFNQRSYNRYERVRINGYNAPEKGTLTGAIATLQLRRTVLGRIVTLAVRARDLFGRLVCDVSLN